jgi:hypothetical protein
LPEIAGTDGMKLLYNHANWSGNNPENITPVEFAKNIIDKDHKKSDIKSILRNLRYAIYSIASIDYPQRISLLYLPPGFSFDSRL